ncbi:MAG: iron-containing alcohol dehydrogenase [Lachnospiraceae bacterium]|nr:iron-containing alcohol dehydrogenase [Lachnospiraceae bacterium]
MLAFEQYTPTKVVFGKDTELQTGKLVKEFGGTRVFVVYGGGSVVRSGLLDRVMKQLEEEGIACMASGGVKPNPTLAKAKEMIKEAIEFGADFVLAVGGGSAIDTGKAVAHGTANPDKDFWDLWLKKIPLTKSLPIGCVLTLSATGTEMSDSAVLTNEETHYKKGISTPFNRPAFSIMNPELTYTLPDYQVRCGIVDIMMHTLDRYFCGKAGIGNELTDQIAESVLRTTIAAGKVAAKNKCDYDAMSELMWCGSISHNGLTGLGGIRDFSVHGLGHPLSAWFDTAHGASLSVMWGWFAEYVWQENPSRFARYARNVWGIDEADDEKAALAGIKATVDYFKELDMPTCFTEANIPVQDEEMLGKLADNPTAKGTATLGSFKKLTKDEVIEIYKMANH